MASVDNEATNRLRRLSQCCICLMTYTDPRLLPCFHTACLKCFEDIHSKNKKTPGDVLPCPMCRKEFTIPLEGMEGLPKNFFIESLIEVTNDVNLVSESVQCNACGMIDEVDGVIEATMKCLNCCENYCLRCSKIHKNMKLTKDHKIVEINSELNEDEIRKMFPVRQCIVHCEKVLDYYCSDCKVVVCVSCFVEKHRLHECQDVSTVDTKFRKSIEEYSARINDYKEQMLSKKVDLERQKNNLVAKTLETEIEIRNKSQQLKTLIDQHTESVLDELSLLNQQHQKNLEIEAEEIETKVTVLERFVTYCTELKSKGSPSELCWCADNLIARAKELSAESHEYLITHRNSVEFEFIATDQNELLQIVGNVVGKVSERKPIVLEKSLTTLPELKSEELPNKLNDWAYMMNLEAIELSEKHEDKFIASNQNALLQNVSNDVAGKLSGSTKQFESGASVDGNGYAFSIPMASIPNTWDQVEHYSIHSKREESVFTHTNNRNPVPQISPAGKNLPKKW